MKYLIISNYDCEYDFTYVVIDNSLEVERGTSSEQLRKYGLYDAEWHWFDTDLIDFNKNEKIQEFDMIIFCNDGSIKIYNHYCDIEK